MKIKAWPDPCPDCGRSAFTEHLPNCPATKPGYVQQKRFQNISVREWYAGLALVGLLAFNGGEPTQQYKPADAALDAFRFADAMVEASNR